MKAKHETRLDSKNTLKSGVEERKVSQTQNFAIC